MFNKIFGRTEAEQLAFLQPRILVTAPFIIIGFIILTVSGGSGCVVVALACLYWGWEFLKGWFGKTSIAVLFSGSVLVGVMLFVLYLVIGYIVGLITFAVALIRYIYLLINLQR